MECEGRDGSRKQDPRQVVYDRMRMHGWTDSPWTEGFPIGLLGGPRF